MAKNGNGNGGRKNDPNEKASAGHLKPPVTFDTSVRAGRVQSVRLPRAIPEQNRKGCGNPFSR